MMIFSKERNTAMPSSTEPFHFSQGSIRKPQFFTALAVLTPAVPQIHSHRQTISLGAHRVSPAIFLWARRHRRRRIPVSRQLSQDFRQYFFHISLHWTSRFR